MKTEDIHVLINSLNKVIRSKREERGIKADSYLTAIPRIEKLFGPIKRVSIDLVYNEKPVIFLQLEARVVDDIDRQEVFDNCASLFTKELYLLLLDQKDKFESIIQDKYGVE